MTLSQNEIEENRRRVRDELERQKIIVGIDPDLAEAICWQEERCFDPASCRFEPAYYERNTRKMEHHRLRELNPEAGGRCSYGTEQALLATSFGPMHILGATARDRGCECVFLTELATSLYEALHWGCRQLQWLWDMGVRRGLRGDELLMRVIAAYNAGPGAFKWDVIPNDRMHRYVLPVLEEYRRLKQEKSSNF